MRTSLLLTAVVALAASINDSGCRAAEPKPKDQATEKAPSLSNLSLEISALQALNRFEMTTEQMNALRRLAADTMPKNAKRDEGKASDKVRKTMLDLRTALIKQDADRIDDLEDALADLLDDEDTDLDDQVNITSAARRRAPEVLQGLRPAQVLAFFNNSGDDLPAPLETLLSALDVVRELKDDEWKDLSEEIVEEMRWLLGGLDPERNRFVADKVEQYLKKVRAVKAKDFEKARPEMERSARQFVGQIAPTVVLHNFAEHALAELLSNPRLLAAIDARLDR
jgi:hypothetical protein